MNHASLERSDRLQRVAGLLADGREYTTLQIIERAKCCAVNSRKVDGLPRWFCRRVA